MISAQDDTPLLGWTPLSGGSSVHDPSVVHAGPTPTTPPPGAADASAFLSAGPPRFQRAPRAYAEPPREALEISAPPPRPTAPTSASWVLGISVIVAIASISGIGFYAYVSYQMSQQTAAAGAVNPMAQLWWLPLLSGIGTLGSIAGIVQQFGEPRRYKRELARREQAYRAYLDTRRAEITRLQETQRATACISHPTPGECLLRVERRDRRLWERTIDRDLGRDLLDLRLGIGVVSATFTVKAPQSPGFQLDADPLQDAGRQLADDAIAVGDTPIALPLARVGSAGIAGDQRRLQQLTGALLMQLATHNAPSEVKLILSYPAQDRAAWEWARWLPHTWNNDRSQRYMAASHEAARRMLVELTALLKQRELMLPGDDAQKSPPAPLYVVVFADPSLLNGSEAPALAPLLKLLESGPRLGVYALFLHDRAEQIRKECGAVIDLPQNMLRIIGPPPVEYHFVPDAIDTILAERFARTIAPLRAQTAAAGAEIPTVLSLLDMLGVRRVEDVPVLQNWKTSVPYKSLAAPIGKRAGGDLVMLDFHERGHGPHGLGAGTTGSGKSELLQTLIASLAVRFHPHELAFVLIDYKGGGMAAPFRELPHQIGIITNLEADMVPRAINALKVENERRQRMLDQAGVNNIDAYQQLYRAGKTPKPLPHLLVLVDEFAELAQNQPDLMNRLISTARVGRSLGVHLLLATQKPAGIVNEQIWSNSNFRLCLRVAQPEDSQELLKRPDASQIPNNRPGRGYLQVGQNEIFELFQSAYSGAPYAPGAAVKRAIAAEIGLDGNRIPLQQTATLVSGGRADAPPSQLQALVGYLQQLAKQEQIQRLDPPWMPPLPDTLPLSRIRAGRAGGWNGQGWQRGAHWMQPVIGLIDDPAHRAQAPFTLDLAGGHLAIYGGPGTGKTTLLQTIALSLALDHTPDQVNMYLIDFGGRRLKLFETLPHVGGVVLPGADEQAARLFFMLLRELERRKDELVSTGETSFAAYHQRIAGAPPAIVVLVNNYTAFANDYPEQADELIKVASEGGNLGIHVVLTAGSSGAVPMRLANSLSAAIALELNDIGEYPTIVGRTDGLLPARGVPGRGLVRGTPPLEFQAAHPGDQPGDQGLREQFAQLDRAWDGSKARPIPVLPDNVALDVVLTPAPIWNDQQGFAIPLGIDAETMNPLLVDLAEAQNLLIAGPSMCGKTTVLQGVLLALAEHYPPARLQFYLSGLTGMQLQPFTRLPHTRAYLEDGGQLNDTVTELVSLLRERRRDYEQEQQRTGRAPDERAFAARYPLLVLAIDDYAEARGALSEVFDDTWKELVRLGRRFGLVVVAASATAYFQSFYGDELARALKDQSSVLVLGGTDVDSVNTFGLKLRPEERGRVFGPGRGYYKRRAVHHLLQAANCQIGALQMPDWIDQITRKR